MIFKGQQRVDASREKVWLALNDPLIIKQCIEGCESIVTASDDVWEMVVSASVGPVKARFRGTLEFQGRETLKRYRLKGRGEGGAVGLGEMELEVVLEDVDGGTLLHYDVVASVRGKLAQIGARLIGSAANRLIENFFVRFVEILTQVTVDDKKLADFWSHKDAPILTHSTIAKTKVELVVNGSPVSKTIDNRTLLVDFLRRDLGLTGTHVGCDTSQCGACTIQLNGEAVKSCTQLVVQANGSEVITIEGLSDGQDLSPLQEAFIQCHGLQCGFCTPGMIMAADALLSSGQKINYSSISKALKGNLCRCTGYYNIVKAVMQAAKKINEVERTIDGVVS